MTSEGQHGGQRPSESTPEGFGADGFLAEPDGRHIPPPGLPRRSPGTVQPPGAEPHSYAPPPHATPNGGSPFVVPAVPAFGSGPPAPPARPGPAQPDRYGNPPAESPGPVFGPGASRFGDNAGATRVPRPDEPRSAWPPPPQAPPAEHPHPYRSGAQPGEIQGFAPGRRGDIQGFAPGAPGRGGESGDVHGFVPGAPDRGGQSGDVHGFAPGAPDRGGPDRPAAPSDANGLPDTGSPGSRPPGVSAFGDQRVRVPGATLTGLPESPPFAPPPSGMPQSTSPPSGPPRRDPGPARYGDHGPYRRPPATADASDRPGVPGEPPVGRTEAPPAPGPAFGAAPSSGQYGVTPAHRQVAEPPSGNRPFDGRHDQQSGPARPRRPYSDHQGQPFGDHQAQSFGDPAQQPPGDLFPPVRPFGDPPGSGRPVGNAAPGAHPYGEPPTTNRPGGPFGAPDHPASDAGRFGATPEQPSSGAGRFGAPGSARSTSGAGTFGPGPDAGASGSRTPATGDPAEPFGVPPTELPPYGGAPAGRPLFGNTAADPHSPAADSPHGHSAAGQAHGAAGQAHGAAGQAHGEQRPTFGNPADEQARLPHGSAPGDPAGFGGTRPAPGAHASPDTEPDHLFGRSAPAGHSGDPNRVDQSRPGFAHRVPGATFATGVPPAAGEPHGTPVPQPRDPAEHPATGTARPVSASASVPTASRVAPADADRFPPKPASPQARVYGRATPPPPAEAPVGDDRGTSPAYGHRDDHDGPGRASASARVAPPGRPLSPAPERPPGGAPFTEFTTDIANRRPGGEPDRPAPDHSPDHYGEHTTDISGRGQADPDAYVPAPALPSMHAAPPLDNGFPRETGDERGERDRPRLGGLSPGPANRATVTPPPDPDATASWPGSPDGSAPEQGRFDQFKADAPSEPKPENTSVRMIPTLIAVIVGAALVLGLAIGVVWLIARGSDGGFSVAVGECVARSGEKAVEADCATDSFEVVQVAATRDQCSDPAQPYVVNPTDDGRTQVLCLKPRG